ncbi:MAG: D-cysteine desulfhydrase family protein [Anaerolineales bacterium]|nr:D-cysteine desulfhydrase family protein [Anaerolineales bacterium]
MKEIARLDFAHLPTPVERLPRLSEYLGGPEILVKRDDQTGLATGGNKTRKLEYLLAEAQGEGAGTLITTGAVQSNHCRQTAAAAARCGFDCILVLVGEQPETVSGNLFLDQLFGAEIVWTKRETRDETLQRVFSKSLSEGGQPYLVPYGGSNPTGASAYAFAMKELIEQGIAADWIVFASSSGGTQAGMVVGAHLFGFQGQVLGISVDEPAQVLQSRVAELARGVADFMGEGLSITPQDIQVNADYLGGGYGVVSDTERESIRLFAIYEGILLDPVYTGRAAGGMIDLIRKGFFSPDERVLFWHTGGMPALFAEKYRGVV